MLTDELPEGGGGGQGGGQGGAGLDTGAGGGMGGLGGAGGDDPTGPSTGPGGFQECLTCAATNCPEAIECFADEACRDGLACGVSMCLGGGSPDVACFLECFDGDTDAAFKAFQALTCVFMSCGDTCGDLLGGGFP